MSGEAYRNVASADKLALVSLAARLLFENGRTTHRTVSAVAQLGRALGLQAGGFLRWGELTNRADGTPAPRCEIVSDCGKAIISTRCVTVRRV